VAVTDYSGSLQKLCDSEGFCESEAGAGVFTSEGKIAIKGRGFESSAVGQTTPRQTTPANSRRGFRSVSETHPRSTPYSVMPLPNISGSGSTLPCISLYTKLWAVKKPNTMQALWSPIKH